jgi:TolB protein
MSLRSRMSVIVLVLFAAPSFAATPPKERIIWMQAINHAFGLYLSNSDGSNERPLLASFGSSYNPSFSLDAHWIIFTSERYGSADVFRVHPDGSGLERLTDSPAFDDQGSLSPDGRTLAFVSTREGGTANIWLLDIASRHVRNLTRSRGGNFRPSWSPDGKWIAFSSDRDTSRVRFTRDKGPFAWELMQTTAIYIVHPDGTGLKRLTALDGSAVSPKWSSDSRRVLFAQAVDIEAMRHFRLRTQIAVVDINSGAGEVHSDANQYVWAPAYIGDTEIGYGINDPRDRATSIAYSSGKSGPDGAKDPSWSPDGTVLVYDKEEPVRFHWTEVRPSRDPRYELIGGKAFTLSDYGIPFTRGGRQFLFVENTHEEDLSNPLPLPFKRWTGRLPPEQLRLARWDGTLSPVIFDGGASNLEITAASLAADDQTIALELRDPRHTEEGTQIAVMRTDGSAFRIVTQDGNNNRFPSLSPDGTRLVYQVRGSENGLRIRSLADGSIFKLTNGVDAFPAWSPRGDRILFTGFETGDFEIYTIRPDGTGLRQLTHAHGNDAHALWSPDGQWIAFTSSRMGWKDEMVRPWHWAQSYGEIFVMRADGTEVRQLTDNQWEEGVVGWAPPGSKSAESADPTGQDR